KIFLNRGAVKILQWQDGDGANAPRSAPCEKPVPQPANVQTDYGGKSGRQRENSSPAQSQQPPYRGYCGPLVRCLRRGGCCCLHGFREPAWRQGNGWQRRGVPGVLALLDAIDGGDEAVAVARESLYEARVFSRIPECHPQLV